MADPKYVRVRLDDSIGDQAILAYDASRDVITDSGSRGSDGSIRASSGSISLGTQTRTSGGDEVVTTDLVTGETFANAWYEIGEIAPNTTYTREYEALQVVERFAVATDILENPSFPVHVPLNESVFRMKIHFVEANPKIEMKVTKAGRERWREVRAVSAGEQNLVLQPPFALLAGDYEFSLTGMDPEVPVKVMGEAQTGQMAYSVTFRKYVDTPLATQTYVQSHAGGTGSGGGDMLKSVYDTDDDGKVNAAQEADKVAGWMTAGKNEYYGKNNAGILGFHALSGSPSVPETSNKVYVHEITTPSYNISAKGLDTNRVPYFVYEGSQAGLINLPHISNMEPQSVVFGITNESPWELDIGIRAGDLWNGKAGIKSYKMTPNTGVIIVVDVAQTSWFVVATKDIGHFSELADKLLIIEAELQKHETAINAHGTQLAQHASQIKGADSTANSALTLAQQNAESIVTTRKNAVTGITVVQDSAHKTITLKLISDTGVVDTGVIDLSSWISGVVPPSSDHKIYYGFTPRLPLDEATILRLGTSKTVPTVSGLDVQLTRTSQVSSYMYVWIPDSAGAIKGFMFSGFLSVWGSTALTIAGAPGKLYSSPNKTSSTNVNFEVSK